MHKLAKGLKKKKKGKKSKHKEEELFKPEELEAYRREHAATTDGSSAKNEEWKNFLSLTSGVDDILKKTQDDLDRIKSTSFFQRIRPPSKTEVKKEPEPSQSEPQAPEKKASAEPKEDPAFGIVQLSESESDEEEDDDIFDTTYIDAIAAGEVKLAYIPESPTEKPDGDDPFDTSIADRAILGPVVERKGKRLVALGAAVEVLTGRVQLPTCATKPVSTRRQILKEKDLLLGSFDNGTESSGETTNTVAESSQPIKTLLDDDEIPFSDEPIDLSKSLYIPPPQQVESQPDRLQTAQQAILNEFEDDEDKEFEALAAESLSKSTASVVSTEVLAKTIAPTAAVQDAGDWKPFEKEENSQAQDIVQDPFDTTFAENILPGKAELKLLEKEILENDVDFDPRSSEPEKNFGNSVVYKDKVPESKLNLITPIHRDLLGGSTSDLSKLGDKPIQPTEETRLEDIKYCDPFDTSIVEAVKAPGQAELKLLENELLGDIKPAAPTAPSSKVLKSISIDDDSFNPRALEDRRSKARTLSRPDVLNVGQVKTVSFTVPAIQKDLLGAEDTSKIIKPLTPFYVRKNSVPGIDLRLDDHSSDEVDPFDTSFVPNIAPGKAELKQIESELFCSTVEKTLEDPDFDPRDESKIAKFTAVEAIKDIANPKPAVASMQKEPLDLLSASNDSTVKVLTPAAEINSSVIENTLYYADPFDTSIASNLPPGKAELKLLENELIQSNSTGSTFLDQNKDLLVHSGDTIIEKPLSPQLGNSFDIEPDDFDPFDTSFASNIQPGRAELKVLESELM